MIFWCRYEPPKGSAICTWCQAVDWQAAHAAMRQRFGLYGRLHIERVTMPELHERLKERLEG